jgi:predicted nucleotidyltransferase
LIRSRFYYVGSYARNSARAESDIDVAVIYNRFSGNWLETSAKLFGLCWGMSSYIEPILLDRARDPSGFVEEVLRTGIRVDGPVPAR